MQRSYVLLFISVFLFFVILSTIVVDALCGFFAKGLMFSCSFLFCYVFFFCYAIVGGAFCWFVVKGLNVLLFNSLHFLSFLLYYLLS